MSYGALYRGRFSETNRAYHVTTVTQGRQPVFRDLRTGRLLVRELMAVETDGWAMTLCYVVMPDHLHWLFVLGDASLGRVMGRVKGRVAHAVGYPIWQERYYDHAVRAEEDLRTLARYIVSNPLRAGLVTQIGDYPLWWARWLEEGETGQPEG